MSYNGSRIPLHMQNNLLHKSLESGVQKIDGPVAQVRRDLIQHQSKPNDMSSRKDTHAMSLMRRNHDGKLDMQWAKNMVVDAIRNSKFQGGLQPIQAAMLKTIFPELPVDIMESQANVQTKLSPNEKKEVRKLVETHMKQVANWNTGRGGGNVPPTDSGTP